MLGWVFDSSARAVCRSVGSLFGRLPQACLTDAGRPLLVLLTGALVVLIALVWALRTFRA